jgi:polar amino acid transport system substrate-binding protein
MMVGHVTVCTLHRTVADMQTKENRNMATQELVMAFQLDTPPYVMDEAKAGIEVDIVREALRLQDYTFTTCQMPYGQLADAIATKGVDAAAAVIKREDGTYYSENYVTFKNVAITMKSSGIAIGTIADLKGKSIVSWEDAYEDLGPEFQKLFSPEVKDPYRKKYREIADQKNQVEMFWQKEAEVIVIDESVMRWFTREWAGKVDTSPALVYHRIFPGETQFRMGFRREQVRDDFNAGLKQIRASGIYRKICDKYT